MWNWEIALKELSYPAVESVSVRFASRFTESVFINVVDEAARCLSGLHCAV